MSPEGNDHADTLAKKGAAISQVDPSFSQPLMYYTHLVERIQLRLVAIVQSLPPRTGERFNRRPPPPCPPLSSYFGIWQHSHYFTTSRTRINCLRCPGTVSVRGGDPKAFLLGQCISIGTAHDRPTPAAFEALIADNTWLSSD